MLNPSFVRSSSRPAASRYSVTTLEPGARLGLTHGLIERPALTAFLASKPAPTITDGLLVFVQLVIAAITTDPWLRDDSLSLRIWVFDVSAGSTPCPEWPSGAVSEFLQCSLMPFS